MSELKELNERMYEFVGHWADGSDLKVGGVSLADCIAYDVLSVIGRQVLTGMEKEEDRSQEAGARRQEPEGVQA